MKTSWAEFYAGKGDFLFCQQQKMVISTYDEDFQNPLLARKRQAKNLLNLLNPFTKS